ncbi:MAG: spore coat U domain-containing protein [Pseudoxanthomonas sp.]|nr:spore coat U domain-containing protein [Pseudoxanthomonas sp.]
MNVPWRWGMLLALAAMLACAPSPARAQQCWVQNSFGLDFGTVTPAGARAGGEILIRCQAPYNSHYYFTMCVFLGPGAQGSINPRRMTNYNGAYLDYDIFAEPAHQQMIGDVSGPQPVYQLHAEAPANDIVEIPAYVYGQVHPGQSVPTFAQFKEVGIQGKLLYLFSPTQVPLTSNCSGGATSYFSEQEIVAWFEDACTLSATNLDFGETDTLAQPVQDTSSIRVECPSGADWSLGLGTGMNYAGGMRRMAGNDGQIGYELYRDPARSQAWGDTGVDDRLSGSTDAYGNPVTVTVYGRVPAQADMPPGHYYDIVVATLYY